MMISGPASSWDAGPDHPPIVSASQLVQQPKDHPMDMNELFYRHQMALMATRPLHGASARHADFDLPGHYADRIDAYRVRRGMSKYFAVPARPETAPVIGA
jgi:hypothetical protein